MSSSKKYFSRFFTSTFIIPAILVLSLFFITISFMNCKIDSSLPGSDSTKLRDSTNDSSRAAVLEPENYSNIVTQVANQYPNDLNEACTSFYFLDQVVEALRAEDVNFGYSCEQGDCENISKDSVTFYQGSQDTQKDLSNVAVIKVIDHVCDDDDSVNPVVNWNIQSEVVSQWKFPRINGRQETGSINLNSNLDCSLEDKQVLLEGLANTYSEVFSDSCQDNDNINWGFVDRVLDRLHSENSNWGYFCPEGDCNNLSSDTIAYNCGSENLTLSALIINIIDCSQESPQITWEMQNLDENTGIGWRYPRVNEDISRIVAQLREPDSIDLASQSDDSDDSDSQEDICPSDKVEPHYKAVGQECLPSCGTAGGTHAGGDCQDTTNYNITLIGGTYETSCCTRRVKRKISGICDNSKENGCHAGDLLDTTDSDEDYQWNCLAIEGGTSVNCSKQRPRADGRCDYNSPTPKCSVGRLVEQADDDEHEKWICKGIGSGGTDADCKKQKHGRCDNSRIYGCSSGVATNKRQANGFYRWGCAGSQSTQTVCSKRIPVNENGRCDTSVRNGCHDGTFRDTGDSRTHYRWECTGIGTGSTTDQCELIKPPTRVNGRCNNSQRNDCSSGTANDAAIADTSLVYRWHCVGSGGGSTDTNCQKTIPAQRVNGRCNNSKRNGCSPGTANPNAVADTETFYKWQCIGSGGGSIASDCQKARPPTTTTRRPTTTTRRPTTTQVQVTCGRCGSSNETCAAGDPHNHPPDTETQWLWTCRNIPHQRGQCAARELQCDEDKPPVTVTCGSCDPSYQGNSNASCSAGTFHPHPGHTDTKYRWTCRNIPHQRGQCAAREDGGCTQARRGGQSR